jgi:glyoxylase-like metal-dependent hydrolase (beta-lactamase superfamily II)
MRPFQLPPVKRLHWLSAGYCTHREWVTIRGGVFQSVRFPAGFACIEHPKFGLILFDTGYSQRFAAETAYYPAALYRWLTPVFFREQDSALAQLQRMGYRAEDVSIIVISHFHGDHIAGLRDFPHAQFIYAAEAYEKVRRLRGLAAVKAGYLPRLLPDDFEARSRPLLYNGQLLSEVPLPKHHRSPNGAASSLSRPQLTLSNVPSHLLLPDGCPFTAGFDILGDGSLLAVDLPGHADGQIGLFISTEQQDYLLCADAAWSSRAIHCNLPPHLLAGLIMSNRAAYKETFAKLIELDRRFPSVRIVPSHCFEAQRQPSSEGDA